MFRLNKMETLKTLSIPLKDFLMENFNQHCAIIITVDGVKVVQDEMYTPLHNEQNPCEKDA